MNVLSIKSGPQGKTATFGEDTTVIAHGPVIIQGMDIKKELESVQSKLESLTEKDEKKLIEKIELVLDKIL